MRNLPKPAIGFLVVLACLGAGLLTVALLSFGAPAVTVHLTNAAAQPIASVELVHSNGLLRVDDIGPGGTRTVHFHPDGESNYRLHVTFADGHAVNGGAGYVEPGYVVTEVIGEHGIASHNQLLGYLPAN